MTSITAEVDDRVAAALSRLSARSGSSPEVIAGTLLSRLVEEEEAFWGSVRAGDAAVAQGDYVTQDEMVAELRAILAAHRPS